MKVYITKYALTKGILEAEKVELYPWSRHVEGIFVKPDDWKPDTCIWVCDSEYATTLERAKFMADEMRQRKIMVLKKQIAKLEEMEF